MRELSIIAALALVSCGVEDSAYRTDDEFLAEMNDVEAICEDAKAISNNPPADACDFDEVEAVVRFMKGKKANDDQGSN